MPPNDRSPGVRATPAPSRGSLGAVAYAGIRKMIVSGELAPGDRILEQDCAALLGISRTPVREAIGRLTSEGLISRTDGGAPVVVRVSADDILDILHVRRLLEVEAARRACDSPGRDALLRLRQTITGFLDGERPSPAEHIAVDDELHGRLALMARSRILADLIANLRLRTRLFDKSLLPDRFEPGCREHIVIIDAVLRGDAEAAEAAIRLHLDNVGEGILELLKRRV